ncbi:fumarylacetoacetate hydrolase family protein [Intestinibacter bartlettii]|uniref:Fumarylacetoacetate hydrolase family protein n=1 Tax=Intestinibacter bartlettii TaxID=261299 RepID=A0ABS6DY00_9FIRM|nr:fumarylacetoacetate hydrolase family protein [Intestinibacter bartlettii]MBU5336712.1 fumarylacetoacetate hydrolase family protein [Intestinibacter bartlettii]
MRFVTYLLEDNIERLGIVNSNMDGVYNLKSIKSLQNAYIDMNDFIANVTENDLKTLQQRDYEGDESIKIDYIKDIKLCSPIVNPIKDILCLGLNYKDHVEETNRSFNANYELPKYPIYFSKRVNKAIGTNDKITNYQGVSNELDYEVELAVIIGKEGINIKKEDAYDYVFGYTIMNDVSARDLQQRHGGQWFRGKSIDTFTPLGPCIVYKDEIKPPVNLNVLSKVNGEVRQLSNTKHFIFDIPTIISDLSAGMTLKPGDIIATGTPSGVGMGFKPPKYLKSGDKVECTIEKIGTLVNIID